MFYFLFRWEKKVPNMFEVLLSFLIHALTEKAEKILGRLSVNPQNVFYETSSLQRLSTRTVEVSFVRVVRFLGSQ